MKVKMIKKFFILLSLFILSNVHGQNSKDCESCGFYLENSNGENILVITNYFSYKFRGSEGWLDKKKIFVENFEIDKYLPGYKFVHNLNSKSELGKKIISSRSDGKSISGFEGCEKKESDYFDRALPFATYIVEWQPPYEISGYPQTNKLFVVKNIKGKIIKSNPLIYEKKEKAVDIEKPKEKEKPVERETPPKYDITLSKTSYHEDAKKAVELARLRLLKAEADDMVKKMAARAEGMFLDLKLEQMLAKLRNQPKMKTNRQ